MNITSLSIALPILLSGTTAQAALVSRDIIYAHEGVALKGYLAYTDDVTGRRPGVLVVHE